MDSPPKGIQTRRQIKKKYQSQAGSLGDGEAVDSLQRSEGEDI